MFGRNSREDRFRPAPPPLRPPLVERLEDRRLLSASPQSFHLDPTLRQALLTGTKWRSVIGHNGQQAVNGPDDAAGPTDPAPSAPSLLGTIEGINFNTDGSNTGFYHIPADPHGAVGPGHVVSVVNSSIQWHTKAGALQNNQGLAAFFGPASPLTGTFDPKVVYDQYNQRFVVVTLEKTNSVSQVLIAVSDDGDPNGTWHYQKINTKIKIGNADHWFDYPGLAVDAGAIYLTANMFRFNNNFFGGSRLWIINKAGLYGGGTSTFTVHDPSTAAGLGQQAFTLQPAHMFGAAPGGVGTFLVSSGWTSGPTDALSVIRVNDPLTAPAFSNQFVAMGDIDNTAVAHVDAPQPGTSTRIETNDGRVLNAVWRNNALWAVNTVRPPTGADAGEATAHWYKIDTTSLAALAVADQGNISGDSDIAPNTHTYMPSIVVDAAGNMAVNFSASSATTYAGAYYTGRLAGDPAGTLQSAAPFATGVDYYIRTFGGADNRWGDYSAIGLDPTDNATFWAFNKYALARGTPTSGGEDGRWGTRWGSFALASATATGSISGKAFHDRNGNGAIDPSDTPIVGATVFLDGNGNNAPDPGEMNTTTSAAGVYSFAALADGTYEVRQLAPSDFVVANTQQAVISGGASVTGKDFADVRYVYAGSGGADDYLLRLNAAGGNPPGTFVEILIGGTLTYTMAKSLLPSLRFDLGGGDDLLTVDYVNGNPVIPGGIGYFGGAQASSTGDRLVVSGSGAADALTLRNALPSAAAGAINVAELERITVNGNAGNDAVTIANPAPAAAVTLNGGDGNDTLDINGAPSSPVTFNGGLDPAFTDTLNVNAGTFTFDIDANAGTANLNVNVNNAAVVFNTTQHLASLTLSGNGTATMPANGSSYLFTKNLAIDASSVLNLTDNDILWDYTGTSLYETMRMYVLNGRDNAGGLGGIAYADSAGNHVLAPVDNAVFLASDWLGQTIDDTTIIGKYTFYGDANVDGQVTTDDYVVVDLGLGTGTTWVQGDVDLNGVVTTDDYVVIDLNLGLGVGMPAATA